MSKTSPHDIHAFREKGISWIGVYVLIFIVVFSWALPSSSSIDSPRDERVEHEIMFTIMGNGETVLNHTVIFANLSNATKYHIYGARYKGVFAQHYIQGSARFEYKDGKIIVGQPGVNETVALVIDNQLVFLDRTYEVPAGFTVKVEFSCKLRDFYQIDNGVRRINHDLRSAMRSGGDVDKFTVIVRLLKYEYLFNEITFQKLSPSPKIDDLGSSIALSWDSTYNIDIEYNYAIRWELIATIILPILAAIIIEVAKKRSWRKLKVTQYLKRVKENMDRVRSKKRCSNTRETEHPTQTAPIV